MLSSANLRYPLHRRLQAHHAQLIINCFPVKSSSLNTAEVSYLIFYVTSRPHKLPKVASFMEHKLMEDLKSRRTRNIALMQHLVNEIIVKCHTNLNLFAENVIRMLTLLATSSEPDIVSAAAETFDHFSAYFDGDLLSIDRTITDLYEQLVILYAEMSQGGGAEGDGTLYTRLVGLRGIHTVASSRIFQTFAGTGYPRCIANKLEAVILPAALWNLEIPTHSKNFGYFKDNASRKDSIMDTASFSTGSSGSLWASTCTPVTVPNETRMLALTILDECGKIYPSQRVRHLIHTTFQFMDAYDKWWPPLYGVEMYKALVRALKPEHRKLFISEMLAYMEATQPNWSSPESVFSSSATCSSVLSSIMLDENIPIPGLNVVDILTLIIHVLEIWLSFQATEDVNHHKAVAKHMIKLRLTACIGSMALVIYYDQQIPDVICLLFSMTSNRATLELRQCLVAALKLIMKNNMEALTTGRNCKNAHVRAIPAGYIQPNISLLLDSDPAIRADFAVLLIYYLEQISDTELSDKLCFIHALMRTIEEYGRLEHTIPSDMIAVHGLLLALLKLRSAINSTVGLLLQLRDNCQEGAQGMAQQTVLIQCLQQLAMIAECASFGDLMIQAETMAKEEHQWVDRFGYKPGISFKRIPATFEDLISNNDGRANCLPTRQAMLDVLAEHTTFGNDSMWKELSKEPKAITSSGAELEKFRIKSSRDLKLNIGISKAIYSDIALSIDKHDTSEPPRAASRRTFLRQIQSAIDTRNSDDFSILSHAPYDTY